MPLRLRRPALALLALTALALPATSLAYTTGLGDEQPSMFDSPYFKALHVKIARYIAPYDAADVPRDLQIARAWIQKAESQHIRVLVAFYHSRNSPTKMPDPKKYAAEVKKFIADFPEIKEYQPWNEMNRGNVPHLFSSPSAKQAAQYYLALRHVAGKGRTVTGADVLDSTNINSTLRYLAQFKRDVGKHQPTIWGLHNYSDTNRFRDKGTRAVLKAVRGQVWLTETGGVVLFGHAFPNNHGEGIKRAAKALSFMFKLAASNKRITRLYIFQWTGGGVSGERFDAGLMNPNGTPRQGYFVVKSHFAHHGH
jgi:Glycosyl hydrolase catalytic core